MAFVDTTATCCTCSFTVNSANTTWDYGDSSALDTGHAVTHTYPSSGTYYVTVTKYNSAFTSSMDSVHIVSVGGPVGQPNCASFTYSIVNNVVSFSSTSSCTSQNSYSWNFGDGNFGTGANVSHTYNSNGPFIVTLSVSNFSTFIDTVSSVVVISNLPPRVCASFTQSNVYNVASFISTSTCVGATSYNWSFGDNTYGSGSSVSHTYASAGYYTVKLAVLDSANNLIDTTDSIIMISMPPSGCNALFSKVQAVDSSNNLIPGNIVITDLSTGTNLSYFWDFGDGTFSTAISPTHTYTTNGPYTLCLTVSNVLCSSTFCDTLSVDTNGIVSKRAPGFTIHVGSYTPIGIKEVINSEFSIYPNPVNDFIYIESNGKNEQIDVSIINTSGQLMLTKNYNNVSDKIKLDLSGFDKGMYLVRIASENSDQQTFKILVD